MNQKVVIGSVVLIVFLSVSLRTTAMDSEQRTYERLLAAEAVVAVEILSTDYSATAADGPMVAVAKVLKSVKGPLSAGTQFRFSETAWIGPTYKTGEYRILFLERAEEDPKPTEWRTIVQLQARTDFFIEKDSLSDLSMTALESFLKKTQEPKGKAMSVVFGK